MADILFLKYVDFICRLRVDEIDMGEGQIPSILCYHTTVIHVKV